MKKYLKKIISTVIIIILCSPIVVFADSGLDSTYDRIPSAAEIVMSGGSSGLSYIGDIIGSQPGDENYALFHIIVAIICILISYIITCVDAFKLYKKKRNLKINLLLLIISLIPTVLLSLLCFLTSFPLILYMFILILYVVIISITTKIILKKRLKKNKEILRELVNFDEDKFNKDAFNIYKEIQYAWMNFDNVKIKELVSKEISDKYKEKLEKLKSKNQKNIMDRIEFKSNKIKDIKIDNRDILYTCEMNVTCIDYIIDDKEKVIKGKKDKIYEYTYKLIYKQDIKTKKIILFGKKIKNIK